MIVKTVSQEVAEIIRDGTIRIGSLAYYRDIEDIHRADFFEGVPSRFIKGEVGPLSADELNTISREVGSIYRFSGPRKLMLHGDSTLRIDSDFNVHIFCASQVDATRELHEFKKFGDCQFEIVDVDGFSRAIGRGLLDAYSRGVIRMRDKDMDQIQGAYEAVVYDEKQGGYISWQEDQKIPLVNAGAVFTKLKKFQPEKEFRFVWAPYSRAKKLNCHLPHGHKFVDLNVTNLNRYIRWL